VHASQCEDFAPGSTDDNDFAMTVANTRTLRVDLQWAQPWDGVTTDLDAWLVDGAGHLLTPDSRSTEDNVGVTQKPFELLQWLNNTGAAQTVYLVISRNQARGDEASPRMKFILLTNGSGVTGLEYGSSQGDVTGPTILGHNGAAGAQSVAAIASDESDPRSGAPEPYSSRGPVTLRFGPVGSTPAAPLAAPQVLAKPDVTASDCVHTTFFSPTRGNVFCGTSAAAPHAAGVAALQLGATPSASAADALASQRATATPIGAFDPGAVGAGLLYAPGAAFAPDITLDSAPPPLTRDRLPTFAFHANREASFTCTLDGVSGVCGSGFAPPVALRDGGHTFTVTATDPLAHSRTSPAVNFTVDDTPPETVISSGPATLTKDPTPSFGFSTADPGARFECRFDGDDFAPCSGSATPSAKLADGDHSFEARAIDLAGNVDPTPASRAFTVDTVKPRARIRKHPRKVTSSGRARFTFAASEKVKRFECRVDHKRFMRCRSSRRVRVQAGRHRMQVRAVDRAGNRGRAVTYRWRVLPAPVPAVR
jgi:hypothetical protein